jgi:drug/metabolite transporter (DMT)-like permease
MIPLALAIIASFCYGISKVFIRKATDVDPSISVLYTLLVAPPILLGFAVVNGDIGKIVTYNFDVSTMVNLALAGVFYLAVGRIFAYASIRLIGAARASQLTSTQIVFAAILSVALLNENMSLTLGVGTVAIFLGELLISFSNPLDQGKRFVSMENFRKGVALGLIGGLIWGSAQLFARQGSRGLGSSIMASFISYLFAILTQVGVVSYFVKDKLKTGKPQRKYLLIAGTVSTIALLAQYTALSVEQVIFVTPIVNTSPLITLLVSYLMIQKIEQINRKVLFGAITIVLGAVLVTL